MALIARVWILGHIVVLHFTAPDGIWLLIGSGFLVTNESLKAPGEPTADIHYSSHPHLRRGRFVLRGDVRAQHAKTQRSC